MSVRRRLTAVLFGGAALGATGYIAAVTVTGLAVEEITGSAALAGLPGALAISGTALGSYILTNRTAKYGHRPGLVTGYLLGAGGATVGGLAIVLGSVWLLLAGMVVLGFGHTSNQLARYTGAELYPPEQRASAVSIIVWAATIGSVLGPILLHPGGAIAESQGYSELAGGYLVTVVFLAAAALLYIVALRPDPATIGFDGPPVARVSPLREAFFRPNVRVALAAMVSGQVVMVLIMTATPLHIHHHGSELGIVGLVMSAHTLGMFAFSPLTGWLADRIGERRTIGLGLVVLSVAAVIAALAPAQATTLLVLGLFLLGLGWNLGFVSGSALLTVGLAPELRTRLQGRVDTITWLSSAMASLTSGAVYEWTDYRLLAGIGLLLLVIPAVVVSRHRTELAAAHAT